MLKKLKYVVKARKFNLEFELVCMTPLTLNYSKIWGKREGEGLVSTIKGLSANLERV